MEENYPRDVGRQMAEVIEYWQRNNSDCSWEALARAVEKMGGHGNLVKKTQRQEKYYHSTRSFGLKTLREKECYLLPVHAPRDQRRYV
jgi:hypothetical protein